MEILTLIDNNIIPILFFIMVLAGFVMIKTSKPFCKNNRTTAEAIVVVNTIGLILWFVVGK